MEQYKDEKAFLASIGEDNNDFVFIQEIPELLRKYYLFKIKNQGSDIKEVALAILENQFDIAEWNVSPSLKKAALISILEFSEWHKAYLVEQAKKSKLTYRECRDKVAKDLYETTFGQAKHFISEDELLSCSAKAAEMYAMQFISFEPSEAENMLLSRRIKELEAEVQQHRDNQFIPVAPAEQWVPCKFGDKVDHGHYLVKIEQDGIFSINSMLIDESNPTIWWYYATELFKVKLPEESTTSTKQS